MSRTGALLLLLLAPQTSPTEIDQAPWADRSGSGPPQQSSRSAMAGGSLRSTIHRLAPMARAAQWGTPVQHHMRATQMSQSFANLAPVLPAIRAACTAEGEDPALVAAILDRESLSGDALAARAPGMSLVGWGDYSPNPGGRPKYRAFGGCQADLGAAELVVRGFLGFDLTTPEGQAVWICRHVASSRHLLRLSFPALTGDALEEAAVCAYNASIGGVVAAIERKQDPNLWTTNRDYGRDVLARRDALRRSHPDAFPRSA